MADYCVRPAGGDRPAGCLCAVCQPVAAVQNDPCPHLAGEPHHDAPAKSQSGGDCSLHDHGCAIGADKKLPDYTRQTRSALPRWWKRPQRHSSSRCRSAADIDLDWQTAQAIDLAGRDILEAVRTSVYPKVIDCPDSGSAASTLDAVAGDGVQLKARARVTVRTNIQQLIGGATEETVIARVGQGIVQAIGSTESYKTVLENPDNISRLVLDQGLEGNTAYEIVSIDIADIDVGENIGARLSADQAEADMRVAQANAEQLRASARAREQEMVARTQENRAKVVLAEAEVPRAVAEGFSGGNLGLLDFYELKNVQADTAMRAAIAGDGSRGTDSSNE